MKIETKLLLFIIILVIWYAGGCAGRKFTINSDPSNAKVYYQSRKDTVFKGYTPISFDDETSNIGPASKIMVSKDGFNEKEVNIGGFEGTDISLLVTLEPVKKEKEEELIIEEKPRESTKVDSNKETPESIEKKEIKDEKVATPDNTKPINGKKLPEVAPPLAGGVPPVLPTDTPSAEIPKDGALPQDSAENKEMPKEDDEFQALQKKLSDMEKMLENLKKEKKDLPSEFPSQETKKEQANTNKAMSHLFNAQKLIQVKRLNEALVETYKALQIDNTLAYAYAIQGSIYFIKKDYYSAISAWEKSIELDPSNYEVINVLNRVKARMGTKY